MKTNNALKDLSDVELYQLHLCYCSPRTLEEAKQLVRLFKEMRRRGI